MRKNENKNLILNYLSRHDKVNRKSIYNLFDAGGAGPSERTIRNYLNELYDEKKIYAEKKDGVGYDSDLMWNYRLSEDYFKIDRIDWKSALRFFLENNLADQYIGLKRTVDCSVDYNRNDYFPTIEQAGHMEKAFINDVRLICNDYFIINEINSALIEERNVVIDYKDRKIEIAPICYIIGRESIQRYLFGVRREKEYRVYKMDSISRVTPVYKKRKSVDRIKALNYAIGMWNVDVEGVKSVRISLVNRESPRFELAKNELEGYHLSCIGSDENQSRIVYEGEIYGINDFKSWIRKNIDVCILEEPSGVHDEIVQSLEERKYNSLFRGVSKRGKAARFIETTGNSEPTGDTENQDELMNEDESEWSKRIVDASNTGNKLGCSWRYVKDHTLWVSSENKKRSFVGFINRRIDRIIAYDFIVDQSTISLSFDEMEEDVHYRVVCGTGKNGAFKESDIGKDTFFRCYNDKIEVAYQKEVFDRSDNDFLSYFDISNVELYKDNELIDILKTISEISLQPGFVVDKSTRFIRHPFNRGTQSGNKINWLIACVKCQKMNMCKSGSKNIVAVNPLGLFYYQIRQDYVLVYMDESDTLLYSFANDIDFLRPTNQKFQRIEFDIGLFKNDLLRIENELYVLKEMEASIMAKLGELLNQNNLIIEDLETTYRLRFYTIDEMDMLDYVNSFGKSVFVNKPFELQKKVERMVDLAYNNYV